MIVCPQCRSRQLDGTLYCEKCGAGMTELPRSSPTIPIPQPPAERAAPRPALVVVATGKRIPLQLDDELLLGRPDDARGIVPDIDLGEYGGYEAGVSRRHAILLLRDGRVHVEDLGSGNGTFINGQRVPPETPTPLAGGDELKLAMLILRLEGI